MSRLSLTAGVIGGLGPAATVDFMARVIELTPAPTDQDHVRLLVDQNPRIPNRQNSILAGGESPGPALGMLAKNLERAGADFLVMPCNTAHAFLDDIVSVIKIPFVSIVDATIESLPPGVSAVGVLETPACRKAALYSSALDAAGFREVALSEVESDSLMQLAYAIKSGDRSDSIRSAMKTLAAALVTNGAEAIIVGCTEVPLVLSASDMDVPLISSTDELARKTIAIARGERLLTDPRN